MEILRNARKPKTRKRNSAKQEINQALHVSHAKKNLWRKKKPFGCGKKKDVVEQSEAEAPQIFRRGGKAAAYQKEHVEFIRVFSHGGSVRSLPLTAHAAS